MKVFLINALLVMAMVPGFALAGDATASDVRFDVIIKELPAALVAHQAVIKAHIFTAARMWTDLVNAKPCGIRIAFGISDVMEGDPKKLGYGKSTRSVLFSQANPDSKGIAEQGWAATLRTGRPSKGEKSDVEIGFQTAYVLREFWWDPDPAARKEPVPEGKLDALSVILHELGHAMVFNGWIDPKSGKHGGSQISTYDRWVRWDGTDFYFDGPSAEKVYGKPILLGHTFNNYHHLGDERPDVLNDVLLRNDLMTGYHFQWAKRYAITPLDIAILQDCGIELKK
jgi:hypothetical protein